MDEKEITPNPEWKSPLEKTYSIEPAKEEDKINLEAELKKLLESEDFAEEEYSQFLRGMILLLGGRGDRRSGTIETSDDTALLDKETNSKIYFEINPAGSNALTVEALTRREMLFYPAGTEEASISTWGFIEPRTIEVTYTPFLKKQERTVEIRLAALPDVMPATNEEVKAVCSRVYSIYEQQGQEKLQSNP